MKSTGRRNISLVQRTTSQAMRLSSRVFVPLTSGPTSLMPPYGRSIIPTPPTPTTKRKEEGKTELYPDAPFFFKTFGFPIDAEIVEFQAPKGGTARISWHGWAEGDADHRLDVVHAWLLEELPGDRLRILTQESQIGKPAAAMAGTNTMIDGHQSWLYGLVKAAKEKLAY